MMSYENGIIKLIGIKMNKTISMSIKISEEELEKLKQAS